jgi:hypothetical protein
MLTMAQGEGPVGQEPGGLLDGWVGESQAGRSIDTISVDSDGCLDLLLLCGFTYTMHVEISFM